MFVEFSQSEVARYYAARVPELSQRGKEWRGACPVHRGKNLNFAVNPETGQAHCHSACGRGWDVIGLEEALTGAEFQSAKAEVFQLVGRIDPPKSKPHRYGPVVCSYDYTDENGKLLYQVVRHRDPKEFTQQQPDGNGGWRANLTGARIVPYRLPAMIASPCVFIVEGEKDADNLTAAGVVATTNNCGATNFKPELVPYFAGKVITIIPDNDEKGRKHAAKVAGMLYETAKSVKIIELPGVPEKGDVSDFLEGGGTVEDLRRLYREAPFYSPNTAPHEDDRYLRSLRDEIELAGGLDVFWDMSQHRGIPTPFPNLTRALGGGMKRGEVYAIAARTGHGKTSLGLQFAIKAVRANLGVLIFSMEMTWRTVFQRMVSIEARVDLNDFQAGQEHHDDVSAQRLALAKATAELCDLPFWVSTKSRITPKYLVAEAQRLKAKLPKVNLLIVDHMQLMGSDEKSQSEYEKFTAISRALKQSAKELDLPVLVMAQIKRLEDVKRELDISDIRGSGAIEEDLAAVMLVYEDNEDVKRTKATGSYEKGPVKTWLKLDKNRFGSSGLYLPMLHFKSCTRFDLEARL
jgi:KaiC/GvpD/RAD55 family RecA-like ATPase